MGYAVKLQKGGGVTLTKIATGVTGGSVNVASLYSDYAGLTASNFIIVYTGIRTSTARVSAAYHSSNMSYTFGGSNFSHSYNSTTGVLTLSYYASYSGTPDRYTTWTLTVYVTADVYIVK